MKKLIIFGLLLSLKGFAMKPAPPEDVVYKKTGSTYEVHSFVDKKRTDIKTKDGKTLWSFNEFINRKKPFVSPDGKTILLWGNFYFGETVGDSGEDDIIQVIEEGKDPKGFKFEDIFKESMSDFIKKNDTPVLGGGWVRLYSHIELKNVDFKKHEVKFLKNDKELIFKF